MEYYNPKRSNKYKDGFADYVLLGLIVILSSAFINF